jgi:hypothetical protein
MNTIASYNLIINSSSNIIGCNNNHHSPNQNQNQPCVYAFNRTYQLEIAKTIGDNEVNGELDACSCILVQQSTNGTIIGTKMNKNGASDQSYAVGHAYLIQIIHRRYSSKHFQQL